MTTLRAGGLFAGYGGLELALSEVLDASLAWVSEFDAAPSAVLAHHWPEVPNLGDITAIDWSRVEPVDVITGGSPCQDVSTAGRRAGMRPGTRSGLWASMCDAIDVIRPRLVIWENVRGVLSAAAQSDADSDLGSCPRCMGSATGWGDAPALRALGRVLGDLADLGYDAAWCGLRAADVGAPHARFRVFVAAWPTGDTTPIVPAAGPGWVGGDPTDLTLLVTPTAQLATNGGSQSPEKRRGGGHGPTLADQVEHLLPTPRASSGASVTETAYALGGVRSDQGRAQGEVLLPTPRATDGTHGGPRQRGSSGDLMLPSDVCLLPTPTVAQVGGTVERYHERLHAHDGRESSFVPLDLLMPTPSVADGAGGHERRGGARGNELLLPGMATAGHLARFGRYGPAISRWEQVTRPAPDPTEPTGRSGAHRLSPRFVEWMMGLPDGWVTDPAIGITRAAQLRALGNGVCPQQGAAAVRHLLDLRAAAVDGRVAA